MPLSVMAMGAVGDVCVTEVIEPAQIVYRVVRKGLRTSVAQYRAELQLHLNHRNCDYN